MFVRNSAPVAIAMLLSYMRTEKEGFHSQNSLFVLCTTVNI